ncbi:hypothetical protein [Thiomonas sp. FB-Cd]|uniref:hypothetical protein n=1 Tax=Thiomonas sp. FB-Cd TaxID=1158292 RepID=UPI0012DC1FDD|nr:hypothetical protein [Thiomonas sp. FB-Cd]
MLRSCMIGLAAFLIMELALLRQASAQEWSCDVDDYVTKAIGIEEPWVENAGYLFTQFSNSRPGALTVAPEIEARLSDRLGVELDLPAYTANDPLGDGSSALGPMAAGLKLAVVHTCNMGQGTAALLTVEVEGQYWADQRPDVLPGEGNAVTAQAMWAQLWYPWFMQGEAGYVQRVGSGVASGWFVNTSLGKSISSAYAAQIEVEVDRQLIRGDGQSGLEGYVMPQIAYHASPWLLALGEQAAFQQGDLHTHWSTWVMLEREF